MATTTAVAPEPDIKQGVFWVMLAAIAGFLVPAIFSMGLRWERELFLVPYVVLIGTFLFIYFRRSPISLRQFIGYWPYALIGIAAATFLLLRNIQGQPVSAVPAGGDLVFLLLWVGLVYGVMDALLLNVMPALAVLGLGFFDANPSRRERLTRGLLALLASVLVTVAYHLGYTEFQSLALLWVIVGNIIITASFLLTGSPLAAVVTHVIMHVAAVLHGAETTLQLPPHYGQ